MIITRDQVKTYLEEHGWDKDKVDEAFVKFK